MLSRSCLSLRSQFNSFLTFSSFLRANPSQTLPLRFLATSSPLRTPPFLNSFTSPPSVCLLSKRPLWRFSSTTAERTQHQNDQEQLQLDQPKSKRQKEREEKEKKRQLIEEHKELNEKIQRLLKEGKVSQAEDHLKILDDRGFARDEDTSTLLIKAYCLLKEQNNVRSVLQRMKKQKIPLNIVVFNAVMQMHCDNGHVVKVKKTLRKVYEEKLQPNIKTYKILLGFFVGTEDWENAIRVAEEIKTKEILPDSELMTTLVTLHNALGEEKLGLGMLLERHRQIQAEIKAGLDSEPLPKENFISVFDSYLTKGDIAGALEVVKTMAGLKILPSLGMFDQMLCASVEFRDKQKLEEIFKRMRYFGFYPPAKQFVSLLQLCEKKKKERRITDGDEGVEEVREVGGGDGGMAEFVLRFYENVEKGKIDVFPLLLALQIHFTNQDMGKFEKRLNKIEKTGAISRFLALKLTLFRYLRTQDILGAEAMKEYIKESAIKEKEREDVEEGGKGGLDLEILNSFLDFYAISGNEKEFYKVFNEEMKEEGIQPNTSSFNSVLRLISRVGRQESKGREEEVTKRVNEKLEWALREMKEREIEWDYHTYYFLLKLNVQFYRDLSKAEDLMKKMKIRGIEGGKEMLVLLLRLYAMLGEVEKAEVVLGMMERLGSGGSGWVSKGAIEELVRMYERAGKREKGVEVGKSLWRAREMRLKGE